VILKTPAVIQLSLFCVIAGFIVGGLWARRKTEGTKDAITSICFIVIGALAALNILAIGVKQRDHWDYAKTQMERFARCDTEILDALKTRDEFDTQRNDSIIAYLADRGREGDLLRALAVTLPPLPECAFSGTGPPA